VGDVLRYSKRLVKVFLVVRSILIIEPRRFLMMSLVPMNVMKFTVVCHLLNDEILCDSHTLLVLFIFGAQIEVLLSLFATQR